MSHHGQTLRERITLHSANDAIYMRERFARERQPLQWAEAQAEERGMAAIIGWVFLVLLGGFIGAVLADWMTGEEWIAEFIRWSRG